MIRFECDYLEGACPEIMQALANTNLEQTPGYGTDIHCENAAALIREAAKAPASAVHFLVGGTQANTTFIAAALRPWQAAVCAVTGHIASHESGAIESSGHKVITLPGTNGKIAASQVEALMKAHLSDATWEHVPQPGMVYISQPTEYGTLYSLSELEELSRVCREYRLKLFVDGARLFYALACPENDVSLSDLARLTDAFYIGGTKAGALFGEAMVINIPECNECFRVMMKQRGGLLAKGRLLGIQFEELMKNGTGLRYAENAVSLACELKAALTGAGVKFAVPSPTNQIFPVLPDSVLERLSEKYSFSFWEKAGEGQSVVRFCTSWATRREDVLCLIADLTALL